VPTGPQRHASVQETCQPPSLPAGSPACPGARPDCSGPRPDAVAPGASGTGSGSRPTLCSSSRHRPDRRPRTDHEQFASDPITRSVSGSPSRRDIPNPIAAPWLTTTASDPPGMVLAIRSKASAARAVTRSGARPGRTDEFPCLSDPPTHRRGAPADSCRGAQEAPSAWRAARPCWPPALGRRSRSCPASGPRSAGRPAQPAACRSR